MRVFLQIGLEHCGAEAIQQVLRKSRRRLEQSGVLFPRSPGRRNHTRLPMALSDPDNIDQLRYQRGNGPKESQAALREALSSDLAREIKDLKPDSMILSASRLSSCFHSESEIGRVKEFLSQFSDDINVVVHLDEQSRVLARFYGDQIMSGRTSSLTEELELSSGIWWKEALAKRERPNPELSRFAEIQSVPFWLDYKALIGQWGKVFGRSNLQLRGFDQAAFSGERILDEIADCFGITKQKLKYDRGESSAPPSNVTLAYMRAINVQIQALRSEGKIVTRQLQSRINRSVAREGQHVEPATLFPISQRFLRENKALIKELPMLTEALKPPQISKEVWSEPKLEAGFSAIVHVGKFQKRIDELTAEETAKKSEVKDDLKAHDLMSDVGRKLLPKKAKRDLVNLATGGFRPHNNLGSLDETKVRKQYSRRPNDHVKGSSTGNLIVACMKNEAPYILEWVAYHKAIGFDNFLIYTNGCEDQTSELLDRLQDLGVVVHENNDNWDGKSPQQCALNKALKTEIFKNAEWIAHIDVDEFINVRIGNGTLQDLFQQTGNATNIAMTWRLFGHNGVRQLDDSLVIEQFDKAAPKHCPKPHTSWGFKTLYRNIGAYKKISCHRPTNLKPKAESDVLWVNGSGKKIGGGIKKNGWRSSKSSIGYDLVQLNHYALRSAESYLVKRQRGRALHVDRQIGINYWLRMDFNSYRDVTIQRNLDRTRSVLEELKADQKLFELHQAGLEWHQAKARELHGKPEFEDLFQQAIKLELNDLERVAWCLANDLET